MQSLIEFVGSWNVRERQSLTRLIERIEEALGLPSYEDASCAPWVCARHDDDAEEPALLVSRVHLQGTCVARTTRQLAKELAKLAPAGRGPKRPPGRSSAETVAVASGDDLSVSGRMIGLTRG